MIPKIIHYCWLSNDPIPDNLKRCMASWKKYLPDYDMMLWNFERFPKGKSKWVDDAFANKKYAFAADYIRLYALYNYGGIYLDMDVEVLKPFDYLLKLNTMVSYQNDEGKKTLEVAAFGVEKHSFWIKICLDTLENLKFVNMTDNGIACFDMEPLPTRIKKILIKNGIDIVEVNSFDEAVMVESTSIPVFPYNWFSPKSYESGILELTSDSFSIHHFNGGWISTSSKIKKKFIGLIGQRLTKICVLIKRYLLR